MFLVTYHCYPAQGPFIPKSSNNVPVIQVSTSIFLALVSAAHAQWNQLSPFQIPYSFGTFVVFQYRHVLALSVATGHSQ